MANAVEMKTKDGRQFYELRAYSKEKARYYTSRWYVPDGWSRRAIENELKTQTVEFQQKVDAGKILSKQEQRDLAAQEKAAADAAAALAAAEAAKLKTVRQYAEGVWMPTKTQLHAISENTRLSYQTNLEKHIFPVLGGVLIKDVTPAMVSKLLLDFQINHRHGSAIKLYNVLNGLFDSAFMDDTIPFNPMLKVKRPKQSKDERAVSEADKAFTAEELNRILDCVAEEPLKWQAFIHLTADTGARRGELCGLRWADIDYKNSKVVFRHNLQYSKAKGVYDVSPKGGKYRAVDIGPETVALLKQHQKKQAETRLSKWVFTVDGEDEPMFPHSPTRYFKTFGDRYNVPGFHPHLLRHTSASLSLTNGADVKSIADRLGHKDASVTLRMYAHANDESIRAAGQAARDALKKQKEAATKKSVDA